MIELFDGYYIVSDEYNYILCKGAPKTRPGKNGSTIIEHNIKGYFGSVFGAVKAFKQDLYRNEVKSTSRTLSDAIRAFK